MVLRSSDPISGGETVLKLDLAATLAAWDLRLGTRCAGGRRAMSCVQ